jgi:AcrR family transcriptional regulator
MTTIALIDTRQRILQAALETLAERRSSFTSLRDIADKAGVHYGNLHYYFRSKEELYLSLLDSMLQPVISERKQALNDRSIPASAKLDQLFERNQGLIAHGTELTVILDFLVQSSSSPAVRAKLQRMYNDWRSDIAAILAQGTDTGEFSGAHAALLPCLVVGLIDGFMTQFLLDPAVYDLAAYFRSIRAIVFDLLENKPNGG